MNNNRTITDARLRPLVGYMYMIIEIELIRI